MITKLVLFLCLFCPVPDKERAILEDALSRCSSLERIGEIMDIVERHHLEYRIPVHPPVHRFHRISSAYGWRSDPVTGQRRFHSGVDIAAELASTVHAAADGKVIYSGRKGGYGYCVMIRHAYGFVTLYGHLSACYVPEGEEVRSGKVIGFIGSSGKSTGNHLHYEVRKYGRPVRPYISGLFAAFLVNFTPLFIVGIFRLIIGGINIIHLACQTRIHDRQILVRKCHI